MKLSELLLAQLEREAAGTRKALERIPEGENASWLSMIIDQNELDLATGGAQKPAGSIRELLQIHERALEAARKSLSNTTDDHLMTSWRLLYGDKVLDDRPRHLILADTISILRPRTKVGNAVLCEAVEGNDHGR
jgi:hypothetical protein